METTNTTGPFAGGAGPTPPVAPGGTNTVSITLRPTVGDVMKNVAGATATLVDLNTLNANFEGAAWSFPAATDDHNSEQWVNIPVPHDLAATPNLRARVHLIVE